MTEHNLFSARGQMSWRARVLLKSATLAGAALAVGLCSASSVWAQAVPIQFRVRAQQTNPDSPDDEGERIFKSPDHDIKVKLDRSRELLKDGRFSEAFPKLQDIIESSEDYFDKLEEGETVHKGLKAEARQLVAEQSAEGLKAYELLFGAKAQRMLADALATGDMADVAEVARRYANTRAGYEATLLAGRYQLDHNEPLAAALCFQRLRETPAAESFEPTLSVLLASCWQRAGMPDRATTVLTDLKKAMPNASLRIAGKQVSLFHDNGQALAWLNSNIGQQPHAKSDEAVHWAVYRGNAARNATSAGGMPLLSARWRSEISPQKDTERAIVTARQDSIDRNMPTLPVMQPLAVGGWVLMRTPQRLIGIDFTTGKRVWHTERAGDVNNNNDRSAAERPVMNVIGPGRMIVQADTSLGEKLWDNATYGTMSSDGEYVFAVEELPDPTGGEVQQQRRQIIMRGGMWGGGMARTLADAPTNELSAYDLHSQGKIKWKVGGDRNDPESEPKLSGAFFLGPPLPMGGRLYVLAEVKKDIKLEVLDAKTGHLEWEQQVALVPDQNSMWDSTRRMFGSTPSYADGVLVCPTSVGAAVAIDLADRSLRWGFQYAHDQNPNYPNGQPVMQMRMGMQGIATYASLQNDRWIDSTVTIADGCALVTPIESNQLYCLSLIDGKPLWKLDRGERIYIGGVKDGRVVIVGRRQIETVTLSGGKEIWRTDIPQGGMPSGRGYLSDECYFLPVSTAEVEKVELATGKIVARAKSRLGNIPGNLICYKGQVISQGVDFLDAYYQLDPLREDIAKKLADNPNDPWALARRGEIALDEGRVAEAVGDIRTSYAQKPEASTRALLVEGLLANLSQNFEQGRDTVPELEKLIVLDSERASFVRVLAEGFRKTGAKLPALEAYLKLVDLPGSQSDLEAVGSSLSVRRDRWVQARLQELYLGANPDDRAKFDSAVKERLQAALAAKEAKDLRRFLSFFGFHPVADEAREQLFVQLTPQDRLMERESLLNELMNSADPARRRAAVARMASFFSEAGRPDEAALYYQRLATEFGGLTCSGGKTGRQLVDELPADSPVAQALAISKWSWPDGKVYRDNSNPSARLIRNNNFPQRPFALNWRGDRPAFYETTSVVFDQQQQQIMGHDGLGREKFRIGMNEAGQNRFGYQPVATNISSVSALGHLLFINLGNQVLAIDTLRQPGNGNRIIWQQELMEIVGNAFNGNAPQTKQIPTPWGGSRNALAAGDGGPALGVLGPVTARGVIIQRAHDLLAVDPLSGELLWTRHGVAPGSEMFGDDEVIVVAPLEGDKARVFRTLDGEELGTRSVPRVEQRWAYVGRNCLSAEINADGKLQVTLSDPWKEKKTALGTFDPGAKESLIGDDSLAVMEPNGHFTLLALPSGAKQIDQQLEAEPQLHDLLIQTTADQYFVIANRPPRQTGAAYPNAPATPAGLADSSMPQVHGHIYAFDRATGKQQWSVAVLIENYYALMDQGLELPVLVLLRPATPVQNGGVANPAVLCIDRRTGRAVLDEDLGNGQPQNNFVFNCELTGERDRKTVTISLPSKTVTLHFTDDPRPPEPPYQAGLAIKQQPFGVPGAIFRALGGAARSAGGSDGADPFGGSEQ